jgi:hypothetical protein
MRLISVTEALRPFNDFSHIPPDVLQKASERGTRIHAAIAAHLTGTFLVTPLPPEEVPLFDSLRLWCDEMVHVVIVVEPALRNEALGFVGHPDAAVILKNKSHCICDWKTPQVESLSWPIQCAAYQQLASKKYGKEFIACAVQPRPDGKIAKAFMYGKNPHHYAIFLNALNAYRWFKGEEK